MMRIIPQELLKAFDEKLVTKRISADLHGFYRKWLRFYLNFCAKYKKEPRNPDSLPDFINKLREKNQPEPFQKQAYQSILVYYDLYAVRPKWLENQSAANFVREKAASYTAANKAFYDAWEPYYEKLGNEIKVRHYSPKTHKAYRNWVRKFQQFLKGKTPEDLEVQDVKAFLTFLAVEQKVSASSQNQAFNALLFFFGISLEKSSEK